MATFSVTPLGAATLSALSATKPAQSVLINVIQDRKDSDATVLSTQDLAQQAFQQALQTATLSPLASTPTGTSSLAQQAAASLLAALNAPQAAAATTPTPDGTTNPVAQDTGTQASTTPATALATEVPAAQDAFATSSSLEFALQTALRFGAGVAGPVAPATLGPLSEAGLVRDATAVLRTGALQAQTGHAGPEAFAQRQVPVQRVLRTYQPVPTAPSSGSLDLMA